MSMNAPSIILRVLDVQTVLVPRLLIARCEALCGDALVGIALRSPSGLLVCPISVQLSPGEESLPCVKLSLPPSEAADSLRPGDLLKSLS